MSSNLSWLSWRKAKLMIQLLWHTAKSSTHSCKQIQRARNGRPICSSMKWWADWRRPSRIEATGCWRCFFRQSINWWRIILCVVRLSWKSISWKCSVWVMVLSRILAPWRRDYEDCCRRRECCTIARNYYNKQNYTSSSEDSTIRSTPTNCQPNSSSSGCSSN